MAESLPYPSSTIQTMARADRLSPEVLLQIFRAFVNDRDPNGFYEPNIQGDRARARTLAQV